MSLFVRKYYKLIGLAVVMIAAAGIFLQQVVTRAATCWGYENRNGIWTGVTIDCTFDCETLDPPSCGNHGGWNPYSQSDNPKECTGGDGWGASGQGPDGIGDTSHHCGNLGSIPGDCENVVIRGNPSGAYCAGSGWGGCPWVEGSYTKKHGYCTMSAFPFIIQDVPGDNCLNDPNQSMIIWSSNELPGKSPTQTKGGFCLDYCDDGMGRVSDYGNCNDGGEGQGPPGIWNNSLCPYQSHYDYCLGGEGSLTVMQYQCDGQPTEPFDYLGQNGYDGLNVDPVQVPATCGGHVEDPVCNPICGSATTGGNNICLGSLSNLCTEEYGYGECLNTTRYLDISEDILNSFHSDCLTYLGADMTSNVQWKEGAAPINHGEYQNQPSIEWDVWGTVVEAKTRENFDIESCGDDQNEFTIDGYCCDDSDDYIAYAPDNIAGDTYRDHYGDTYNIDMSGDYCVNSNDCGNFVLDAGEDCDAAYGPLEDFPLWDQSDWEEHHLYIGDPGFCVGGDYCLPDCTCSGCSINNYDDVNKEMIIQSSGVELLKMDSNGMFLLKGNIVQHNPVTENVDITQPHYLVNNSSGLPIMFINAAGDLSIPFSASVVDDPALDTIPMDDRMITFQADGTVLGVLKRNGNFHIKSCLIENAF